MGNPSSNKPKPLILQTNLKFTTNVYNYANFSPIEKVVQRFELIERIAYGRQEVKAYEQDLLTHELGDQLIED